MKTRLLLLFALLVFQTSFCSNLLSDNLLKTEGVSKVEIDPIVPNLPNLSVCDTNNDGFSVFDLTVQTPLILAAQTGNASDYQVSYYENETDALIGASPSLSSPYENINSFSQTIYFRIRNINTNELAFGSFNLEVNPSPVSVSLNAIEVCDQDGNPQNAITAIDLTVQIPNVLAAQALPQSNYTVNFFMSQANAQAGTSPIIPMTNYIGTNGQTIWYRVELSSTGCYRVGSFQLVINTPLMLTPPSALARCDDDAQPNDQFFTFDLTVKDIEITQGMAGYTVTYYPSYNDALSNTNAISNPTQYINAIPEIHTLGVKVTSPTGCYSYTTLEIRLYPVPTPNFNPIPIATCDMDGDGFEIIDLTINSPFISNGDPSLVLHFFPTMSDALNGTNEIPNPAAALVSGSVWIRVENNYVDYLGYHCYVLVQQQIFLGSAPLPIITSGNSSNVVCVDYDTNAVIQTLTLNSGIANPSLYIFNWYENGIATGVNSPTYTVNTASTNGADRDYSVQVIRNNALGCSNTSWPFQVVQSGPATPFEDGYTVTNLSGVQNITVGVNGYGTYQYSIDGGANQSSPVFENVSLGTHSIMVVDAAGCGSFSLTVEITESLVAAPIGLTTQSFPQGATLAAIVVNGTNVQWYASAADKNATALPLPLNTLLVNGTTYYATQTINGIESEARLPVTVQLTLGTNDNEILPIQYAPNPVRNSLTLQSSMVLKSVLVYTMLGQKVFEQSYDNTNVTIDLSGLNTGNYILKIEGETGQKTLRIVKE